MAKLKCWKGKKVKDGILFMKRDMSKTIDLFFSRITSLKNRYRVDISGKKQKSFKSMNEATKFANKYMKKHDKC